MYHALQSNPYNIAADYRLSCLQNGLGYRFIPKIAFYVSMVSHIDHYKRIWRHINKENFVVLVPANNSSLTTQREYAAILNFLSDENVPYKIYEHALFTMEQYPFLVTMHHDEATYPKPAGIAKFYVRYMIQGLESFAYHPKNFKFSLFLCQSHYQLNKLKTALPDARCEIMGYPRLDDYFSQNDLPPEINIYNRGNERKTILYLPTHGPWSMLKNYLSTLVALTDTYNVIIKPHPDCFTEDSALFDNLPKSNYLHIIKETIPDDWALFKLADYVFVDCGGSVFAAIYTQKNIVFLRNVNASERVLNEMEDRLAQEFLSIQAPDDIAIRNLLSSEELFESKREFLDKYREVFFAPFCESSGKKAATVLSKELESCLIGCD